MRNSPQFHNLLGFTREEILFNFKDQIKTIAVCQKKTEDQLISELEQHYNGYRYNFQAKETLYNAFVIQNYFKSGGELRNYFAESGGTGILLRSLNQQTIEDLRIYLDLLSDPAKRVEMFKNEITTPKDWQQLQKDFKQNCFDAGYLTIAQANGNKLELKVPNIEVFNDMQKLLKEFLGKNDQFGDVLKSFIEARFDDFFEALEELSFKDKTFLNLAKELEMMPTMNLSFIPSY